METDLQPMLVDASRLQPAATVAAVVMLSAVGSYASLQALAELHSGLQCCVLTGPPSSGLVVAAAAVCRHEFCWLCNGSWQEHGERTGGFYACNR
jgi:hypothetical protein